jgi:DNA-binding transcriptional MerR regulator
MESFRPPDPDAGVERDPGPEPSQTLADESPTPAAAPPEYSIAAVSKLTGISCHTLRVWERRYGFPVPVRSPSGHRRYDCVQVQKLRRLTHLRQSHQESIGELISHLNAGGPGVGEVRSAGDASNGEDAISELVSRLIVGDREGADREYERLAGRLDASNLVECVIEPALVEAGEGWFRRAYSVYQERLITLYMRWKLSGLIEAVSRHNLHPSRSVLAGTVQGDRHEGGVMIMNFVLESCGWQVYNMGVDLPVREYRMAIQALHPSALALSFILSRNIKKRFQELETIRSIPVFVGGRSIVNYQSLARSHGLIPITGSMRGAMTQLQDEYNHWYRQHASDRT